MFGLSLIVLIPVCLIKDISKLKHSSILGVVSMVYVILVIAIQCPYYIKNYDKYYSSINIKQPEEGYLNYYNIGKAFDSNMMIFIAIANIMFALGIQLNTLNVYSKLKNRNSEEGKRLVKYAMTMLTLLYLCIGVFGYLTQPIKTPDLIFKRYSLFTPDTLMIGGKLFLILALCCKIPVLFNALKISVYGIFQEDQSEVSNSFNFFFTFITISSTTLVGVLYSEVDDYITILGGYASVSISFLFPLLIYLRNEQSKTEKEISQEAVKEESWVTIIVEEQENLNASACKLSKKIPRKWGICDLLFGKNWHRHYGIILSCVFFIVVGFTSCFIILIKVLNMKHRE